MNANKITKPLIVFRGHDARVPKIESDEVVAAVKKNNVPVEYIVFPMKGMVF